MDIRVWEEELGGKRAACSHVAGVQKAGFFSTLTLFLCSPFSCIAYPGETSGLWAPREQNTALRQAPKSGEKVKFTARPMLSGLLVFVDHSPALQILVLAL